jgi:peroxiredoxin
MPNRSADRRRPAGPRASSTGRRWPRVLVVSAVILVLTGVVAGVAVAARTGQHGADEAAGGVTVERAGGSRVGDMAPVFEAVTTAGERVRVPAGKPTVLFFMAASCDPRVEASALDRIVRADGQRVEVVGVDIDPAEPEADLAAFAGKVGAAYGFVHDRDGVLARAFGVRALDSTVIVDAAGRTVYRDAAPTDEATLRTGLARAGVS